MLPTTMFSMPGRGLVYELPMKRTESCVGSCCGEDGMGGRGGDDGPGGGRAGAGSEGDKGEGGGSDGGV